MLFPLVYHLVMRCGQQNQLWWSSYPYPCCTFAGRCLEEHHGTKCVFGSNFWEWDIFINITELFWSWDWPWNVSIITVPQVKRYSFLSWICFHFVMNIHKETFIMNHFISSSVNPKVVLCWFFNILILVLMICRNSILKTFISDKTSKIFTYFRVFFCRFSRWKICEAKLITFMGSVFLAH